MRKILYLLPIITILLTACNSKNDQKGESGGELKGMLSNSDNDGKQVYLLTMKNFESSFMPIDSTIIENQKFSFNLDNSQEEGVAYIVVKNATQGTPNGIPFVYEKGTIEMYIDSVPKVKGTPMNDKCQVFFDKLAVVAKKMESVDLKAAQIENPGEREVFMEDMASLQKEMSSIGYDFIKENITNKVGEFYLVSFIDLFDNDQIQGLLELATPEYKEQINKLLGVGKQSQNQSTSIVGQKFIDVKGNNPLGNTIALSDYVGKGKVVLVDFWASWCGPCIKEMPNVVAAYAKYKNKGFQIVGISLDEDKDSWVKAIKELNMTWIHMSDLKGWNSQLSAPYNVKGIPYVILIDKDGTIVAENLRGKELDKKIAELLK